VEFLAPLPPTRSTGDTGPASDMNLVTAAISEVRSAVDAARPDVALFDNTGATDCTAAIQAAINAIKTNGGVITFAPGTYRIDGQLTANGSYNVVLRGMGPQGSDRIGPWNTTLLFKKSGTTPCISARASQGFTIDNLAVINDNTSYAGAIVDVGSPGDPTPTYRCTFRNGYIGGPGGQNQGAHNAYAALWLGQVVEAVIENMVIARTQYGLVGRSASEPLFCNVVTIIGGRFADIGIAAILNPYINWTLFNTVFEPNVSGGPAGIKCTAEFPAESVTLVGVSFWDITTSGVWIDYWGNGLTMSGVFAAIYGNSTFVRLNGRVEGFHATGGNIWGSPSDRYMSLGAGASVFYVTANDRFWGGIPNNVPSLMGSMAMNASYQPTLKVRTLTAGTTQLGLTDIGSMLVCNASGGQVNVLLPNPAESVGGTIVVKKDDSSANAVQANGFFMTASNWSRTFVSDGGRWHTTAMVGNSGI
jgi:hypothetical protein